MILTACSRRDFFAALGKSSLAVGFSLAFTGSPELKAAEGDNGLLAIDSWLGMSETGLISIFSGKVELGTGIQTALTQIVAEELSVNPLQISFIQGDTSLTPGDKGYTAGSKTIQTQGPSLRLAAATAFQQLLRLAADRLGTSMDKLRAKDGYLAIGPNGRRQISYADLIRGQQIKLATNTSVVPKSPDKYQIVGASLPRMDIAGKFDGTFTYIQDFKLPDMLHGRVVRPPGRNADFLSLDPVSVAAAEAIVGFVQIVQRGNFVGVVATDEWAAISAAQTLKVNWNVFASLPFGAGAPDMETVLTNPSNIYQTDSEDVAGDFTGAFANPAVTARLESRYLTPYQMHGAMGPSCAVANFTSTPDASGIQLKVWSGTQGVFPLQGAIAQMLSLPTASVQVIYVEAAGCYGHNGADDAAADAALLSREVGHPVRVQWMRQEEHGWEPLGPAMLHRMVGALQGSDLVAWQHNVYTPTHNSRPGNAAGNVLTGQQLGFLPSALPNAPTNAGTRNGPITYDFRNRQYVANHVRIFNTGALTSAGAPAARPLTNTLPRSSALRSLGGVSNTFANESFADELAAAAGVDPISFRLRYLSDPRAIAVVNAMVAQSGWTNTPMAPGPGTIVGGRGVAYLRYETVETYVAAYVEVQVDTATGAVSVPRVVVAHDCGLIINPDGLRNQIEGNVLQGISRALLEEVTFDRNGVTSLLWANSYPVVQFKDAPTAVEIVLLDHPTLPSWGAGEPTIEAIPAAVGNAIFNATGRRLRTLPMTAVRVLAGLA